MNRSNPAHGLEQALTDLADDISSAFEVSLRELAKVRSAAEAVGSEVDAMIRATSGSEDGDGGLGIFATFLQGAKRPAATAEASAEALRDQHFQMALSSVLKALQEMGRCTAELAAISSLTKITRTENGELADRLTIFIRSLDERCAELDASATASHEHVRRIQKEGGLAREALVAIGQVFNGVSGDAEQQLRRLSELHGEHRAHLNALGTEASTLGQAVARTVAELVGCLQFPDAFSQRADHTRSALLALAREDVPEAERRALEAVISAQIAAMAVSLEDVTNKAITALRTLSVQLGRSSVATAGGRALDPTSAWLDADARTSEAMLHSVKTAREQLSSSLALLTRLIARIDQARVSLERSTALNRILETSVHNASIVASRSGTAHSPLRILAGSVKEVVGRTAELIARTSRALMQIRRTSESLDAAALQAELDALEGLQRDAAERSAAQAVAISGLQEKRQNLLGELGRLSAAAAAGASAFAAAGRHAAALSTMAGQVAPHPDPGDGAGLGWLYSTYTMEEERCVHRDTVGLPSATAEAVVENADLDDFLL